MNTEIDTINRRLDNHDSQFSRVRDNVHDAVSNSIKLSEAIANATKTIEEVYIKGLFVYDKLLGLEPKVHALELESVRKLEFEMRMRAIERKESNKFNFKIPFIYWPPILAVIGGILYAIEWSKFHAFISALPR